jgi:hypothetical protein
MSLLRLLTAGKSLVGLKDTGNHYNVASRVSLPKFASKKNPFRASTRPEAGPLPGEEVPSPPKLTEDNFVTPRNCDNSSPASPTTSPLEGAPLQTVAQSSFEVAKSPTQHARTRSPSRWAAFLPWTRPKTEKSAIPRFEKAMIQGELSLESVKVVRNDLSDSDLEVVPTKPVAAPQPKPTQPVTPNARANESPWERLTGRFLGAGKT